MQYILIVETCLQGREPTIANSRKAKRYWQEFYIRTEVKYEDIIANDSLRKGNNSIPLYDRQKLQIYVYAQK